MRYLLVAVLVALIAVAGLLYLNLQRQDAVRLPDRAVLAAGDYVAPAEPPEPPAPAAAPPLNPASSAPPAPAPPRSLKPSSLAPRASAPAANTASSATSSPSAPPPTHTELPSVASPAAESTAPAPPAPQEPSPTTEAPASSSKPFTPFKPDPPNPLKSREPRTVTIPSGTLVSVRLAERLDSSLHHTGDTFRATLDSPLVINDLIIADKGARVLGRIVESRDAGRVKGVASLKLALTEISTSDGQTLLIDTQEFEVEGEKSVKKDAAKIGAATAIGAAIGAIAGGGRGAAIGAGAGGAAGTGGVLLTKGKPASLPAETRLTFRITRDVTITEKL